MIDQKNHSLAINTSNRGGVRPGAGRPTNAELNAQSQSRATVLKAVTPEKLTATLKVWVQRLTEGDPAAWDRLMPYVLGKPVAREEDDIQRSGAIMIQFVNNWRSPDQEPAVIVDATVSAVDSHDSDVSSDGDDGSE